MKKYPDNVWYDGICFIKWNNHSTRAYRYAAKIGDKIIFLHRYKYEKETGKTIPEGFQIHHIDGNRWNNDISNLVMVHIDAHYAYHKNKNVIDNEKKWEERRNKDVHKWECSICGRTISARHEPSVKEMTCSEQCDHERKQRLRNKQ
jgi:hypothetical protein